MVYKKEISVTTKKVKKLLVLSMMMLVALFSYAQEDDDDETGDDDTSPCENIWGVDSTETVKALSMFNQYYQEKEYVKSFPYWYYLFNNAPCIKKRITFNGPYILRKVIQDSAYQDRFDGLVDTIFLVYQKRIELYGDEGNVKAKWANDWAKLRPAERAEALKLFAEAVSITGMETDYKVPKDYIYSAVKEYKKKKYSMDSLLLLLDQMSSIIDYNIAQNGPKVAKWVETQDAVTKMMLPYLDCDKITELKQPLFADKKDDLDYLKSTLKLLDKGGCQKTDFYFQVSEQLYSIEPSASSALALARASKKRDNDSKALSYYKKASTGLSGNELIETYMEIARLSIKSNNLSDGRTYANKVLEINPNYGEAYILIGDAYASSLNACSGSKLKGHEVYWVAVDKYIRAKSVDPSVEEKANEKIRKYSGYFPDKETAFFEGITDGQSYTVGCWIGETTIVRTISN